MPPSLLSPFRPSLHYRPNRRSFANVFFAGVVITATFLFLNLLLTTNPTIMIATTAGRRQSALFVAAFQSFSTRRRKLGTYRPAPPPTAGIPPVPNVWIKLSSSSSETQQHHNQGNVDDSKKMSPTTLSNPIRITSNQELVQRRIQASREKRNRRYRNLQERANRNLHIKRLLHTERQLDNNTDDDDDDDDDQFSRQTSSSSPRTLPSLYAVKVWVDEELRRDLKLTGREKRGRVFLEAKSDGTTSLKALQQELHSFFRALRKDTYLLSATLPPLQRVGTTDGNELNSSTILPPLDQNDELRDSWMIETDEDVVRTFEAADAFFQNATATSEAFPSLKRPSIQINVLKNPNAPPPPPTPPYLVDMPQPAESESMTMLSFYAFPPAPGITDPEAFATDLKKKWRPFQVLGRVYVAPEGVNAQMAVPTNILERFMECCRNYIPELGPYMENDINIDAKPLSQHEFAIAGVPVNGQPAPPFRNLHVRVRRQVVADGLDQPLDWASAGYDMPPLEWHERLKAGRDKSGTEDADGSSGSDGDESVPILLDCRNTYETDVGIFEGAEPLGTENFRDSWDVLKARLADTPKDAPIMTYCTGGIRCVKVGAFLTQEMGFTNVSRLAGGIIAYDRTLTELNEQRGQEEGERAEVEEESIFKGTNFVFDGRLGREITSDALAKCVTCRTETSSVSNCRNDSCHARIVQCEKCRTDFHGTCSTACKNRIVNGRAMAPRRVDKTLVSTTDGKDKVAYESLDSYSTGHSSPIPSAYREMELNTQAHLATGAHMVSGASQGQLLKLLASMSRSGRILECGTFSGYATACLLEGAQSAGQILGKSASPSTHDSQSVNDGPYILTLERDSRAFNLAVAHMKVVSQHGFGEDAAEALCALRSPDIALEDVEDALVSLLTSDGRARCEMLRVNDALAVVESLADGTSSLSQGLAPFDMVFVDADKGRLLEYVDACLSNDRLLHPGGLIVVDNVLWKGLVLEASTGEFTSVTDDENSAESVVRKNRRARKLATQMHAFNAAIVEDERAEIVMLPMRDGLSAIRKK